MATMNAAITPSQRKRHALRTSSSTWSNSCFMGGRSPSEAGFRHHQHVAGLERQVLFHVAVIDQRVQFDLDLRVLAVFRAHQAGAIAGGELTQAPDGEYR